jgi:hypothetical protein
MLRSTWTYSLMTVLTASALVGCGDDKNTTDESTTDPTAATDPTNNTEATDPTAATDPATDPTAATDPATDPGTTDDTPTTTMVGGDTAADGEACSSNGDCASQGCEKFRDLEDGVCAAAPAGGNTRFTGTLVEFGAVTPIANGQLAVLGALSALNDPANASPVLTGTADADGKIDIVTTEPLAEGIGVVGIVTGGDYYTTATGLISPISGNTYGPMNGNRDIWGVRSADLTAWTALLMPDPDFADSLPLGDEGGVIGFVRDGAGAPKAGAKVISATNGDATKAKIRYLAEDTMTFTSDATSSNGIFVLVAPALAEKFKVEGGTVEGTAGSAKKAVFVMILTEP